MQGELLLGNILWRYETGTSLCGVVGCQVVGEEKNAMHIAVPGKDFAFDPPCPIDHRQRVEAAIKREVKRRWPEVFKKQPSKR